MNDYSQCAEKCQEAIQSVESIDGVDPDIQALIDNASYELSKAHALAESRGGEVV